MKKIIDKFKKFNPCKPLAILYILLIITISFFTLRIIDNDFWFLINQGRYIIENGFPTVEPFTIHNNLSFIIQQWLTDVIFYSIYHSFGHIGIIILIFIVNVLIVYLLYKILYGCQKNIFIFFFYIYRDFLHYLTFFIILSFY